MSFASKYTILTSMDSNHGPEQGLYIHYIKREFISRDFRKVEQYFGERIPPIDTLARRQMENALAHNRRELIFLDVGSGDGNLFQSILDNPNDFPQMHEFLRDHADFRVRMIGLTDPGGLTPPPSSNGTRIVASSENGVTSATNLQIEAMNFSYTITDRNPLLNFLSSNNIAGLDLVFATGSLMYLRANTFAQTVTCVVDNLFEGGQFIAAEWSGTIGTSLVANYPIDRSDTNHPLAISISQALDAVVYPEKAKPPFKGKSHEEINSMLRDRLIRIGHLELERVKRIKSKIRSDDDHGEKISQLTELVEKDLQELDSSNGFLPFRQLKDFGRHLSTLQIYSHLQDFKLHEINILENIIRNREDYTLDLTTLTFVIKRRTSI